MDRMKADLKRQKQQARAKERGQRNTKLIFGIVAVAVALAFAASSFTSSGGASSTSSTQTEGFRRITVEELKPLFDRGEVTLIDVRDIGAYEAAHIPGSLQIPLARIDGETPYLPKEKLIVTYCTCPAEESSGQAVQIMAHRGITNAAALQGGLGAWQKKGYAVESGLRK